MLEEQKEFKKIHQGNMCMFIIYLMVYVVVVILALLWVGSPSAMISASKARIDGIGN